MTYKPSPPKCPVCAKNEALWDEAMKGYVCCLSCASAMCASDDVPLTLDLPPRYENASLADFPSDKATRVLDMVAGYTKSLVLWGNTRMGKTHLLCALYRDCVSKGIPATLVTFVDWCSAMKRAIGDNSVEDVKRRYMECQALFLDDLMPDGNGSFIDRMLYELYNYRMNEGLPTYTTMNARDKGDFDRLDDRVRWRLAEDGKMLHIERNYGDK
jgi:DNA replication protein DnaC